MSQTLKTKVYYTLSGQSEEEQMQIDEIIKRTVDCDGLEPTGCFEATHVLVVNTLKTFVIVEVKSNLSFDYSQALALHVFKIKCRNLRENISYLHM